MVTNSINVTREPSAKFNFFRLWIVSESFFYAARYCYKFGEFLVHCGKLFMNLGQRVIYFYNAKFYR